MGDISTNKARWKTSFVLSTNVIVDRLQSYMPRIELVPEPEVKGNRITRINVTTPRKTYVDAVNYAEVICNRCLDYLSFMSGTPVKARLNEMYNIDTGKGTARSVHIEAFIAMHPNFEITTHEYQRIIRIDSNHEDIRLALLLAHFRRGLLARDIVDKIREFYQVLELENHPSAKQYKYIRNIVTHTWLNSKNSVEEAEKILTNAYLDTSSP